jgi:outer membrane protein OmpA-like peptidoglycan-associated protein
MYENLSEYLIPRTMKLKYVLINLFLCFFCIALAQESQKDELKTAGFKTAFVRNSVGSNWFVHLGGGGQIIADRITFFPTASVGKWMNPQSGFRLKGQGGSLSKSESNGENHYYNIHLDAMLNIANYWGAYSPQKLLNLTPYIGLGYGHHFNSQDIIADALLVNGGFQLGFRLSKRIHLDFDLGITVAPDYFDGEIKGTQNDVIVALSGGLTFTLGKTAFESVVPYNSALINVLNDRINQLLEDNQALSKSLLACPEYPESPESPNVIPEITNEINFIPNVVFFRINSAKVDKNQQISIYNTSEFLKAYGEKIKVVGYADNQTGTNSYNLKLSEKRAKAVAQELVAKYNIPSQKIVIEWKGSEEQPYPENEWNRVVIMTVD